MGEVMIIITTNKRILEITEDKIKVTNRGGLGTQLKNILKIKKDEKLINIGFKN